MGSAAGSDMSRAKRGAEEEDRGVPCLWLYESYPAMSNTLLSQPPGSFKILISVGWTGAKGIPII